MFPSRICMLHLCNKKWHLATTTNAGHASHSSISLETAGNHLHFSSWLQIGLRTLAKVISNIKLLNFLLIWKRKYDDIIERNDSKNNEESCKSKQVLQILYSIEIQEKWNFLNEDLNGSVWAFSMVVNTHWKHV